MFLDCQTQWRICVGFGSASYEGIESTSIESAMRMLGVRRSKQRDVLWMVRVMEDEARKVFNKR